MNENLSQANEAAREAAQESVQLIASGNDSLVYRTEGDNKQPEIIKVYTNIKKGVSPIKDAINQYRELTNATSDALLEKPILRKVKEWNFILGVHPIKKVSEVNGLVCATSDFIGGLNIDGIFWKNDGYDSFQDSQGKLHTNADAISVVNRYWRYGDYRSERKPLKGFFKEQLKYYLQEEGFFMDDANVKFVIDQQEQKATAIVTDIGSAIRNLEYIKRDNIYRQNVLKHLSAIC